MAIPQGLIRRAEHYAEHKRLIVNFDEPLGFGQDGCVWKTARKTAIKSFERQKNYNNECGCYQRLFHHGIEEIEGLQVPRLVEMDIVEPPYLLDFGKAYLDAKPPYSREQMDEWDAALDEQFGTESSRVRTVLWRLRQIGIHYLDARPGNIVLASKDDL